MEHVRKIKVYDFDYWFNEVECYRIEKYFDSIRLFMDDEIVDKIISFIPYDEDDVISLVAYYDAYLLENDYDKEIVFSEIMFDEFGVDI